MSTVVGLDLSLTSTGWARVTDAGTITTGRIQSKGAKSATLAERQARLLDLTAQIVGAAWSADLVVIEGPSFGQHRQSGQHDRAGLWWLVVHQLVSVTQVVEVPPASRSKYATGKGNAAKDTVLLAVARRFPTVDITGNDEADALVLAAMGARHLGTPIDDMPLTHTTAMAKVAWPLPQEAPF